MIDSDNYYFHDHEKKDQNSTQHADYQDVRQPMILSGWKLNKREKCWNNPSKWTSPLPSRSCMNHQDIYKMKQMYMHLLITEGPMTTTREIQWTQSVTFTNYPKEGLMRHSTVTVGGNTFSSPMKRGSATTVLSTSWKLGNKGKGKQENKTKQTPKQINKHTQKNQTNPQTNQQTNNQTKPPPQKKTGTKKGKVDQKRDFGSKKVDLLGSSRCFTSSKSS